MMYVVKKPRLIFATPSLYFVPNLKKKMFYSKLKLYSVSYMQPESQLDTESAIIYTTQAH